jgi:hypothetical protein
LQISERTLRPVAKRPLGFFVFRGALQSCTPAVLVNRLK